MRRHPKRYPVVLLVLLSFMSSAALAQDPGQVGISLDAQLVPHVGVQWQATERVSFRASTFIIGGGENAVDFRDSYQISIYPSYLWHVDEQLDTYLGPDVTYSRFSDEWYLGAIWGTRYQLHDRFGIFGEFGLSFDLGDTIDAMEMFNTGAGVIFYVNR